ncbi:MAG: DUF3791 domain-containing protein [Victivallales bacterium]|nr:DUF3791 domain-containing protein [Victivallales bacterium]
MDKEGKFIIYCIERYRQIKGMTGPEVIDLFNKYGILEFIRQFFDLLHINGDQCIVQDIDDYIAEQKAGKSHIQSV